MEWWPLHAPRRSPQPAHFIIHIAGNIAEASTPVNTLKTRAISHSVTATKLHNGPQELGCHKLCRQQRTRSSDGGPSRPISTNIIACFSLTVAMSGAIEGNYLRGFANDASQAE